MSEDFSTFVENYRAKYEAGWLSAGYEAALFCIANQQPIPAWLVPLVEEALKRKFVTSEGIGKGKISDVDASKKAALRMFIRADVDRKVLTGHTKAMAFELVAKDLSNHSAKYWTAEMVKTIYHRKRVATEGL